MSRVSYKPVRVPLQNLVWRNNVLIVLVRGPVRTEVLRQVVFPKKTHYLKSQTTTYTELEDVYRIVRIIHGQAPGVKAGEIIKVFHKPAYDPSDTKAYHTQGLMKSPLVLTRTVQYPITGEERILFLHPAIVDGKKTWSKNGHEGPGAEAEIHKLLAVPEEKRNYGDVEISPQE